MLNQVATVLQYISCAGYWLCAVADVNYSELQWGRQRKELQGTDAKYTATVSYFMMAKRGRDDAASSGAEGETDEVHETVSRSQSTESEGHTPKYTSLEPEEETPAMRCLLAPHKPLDFATYTEYESHYQKTHTNRCTDCKRNFPSSHFLSLHIAENHDPIVATKRDADEKTYACFVEGCEKVCIDWKKRRSHLVDKHGFPKNYDFLVVDHGIDGRRSMLRPGVDAQGHRKSSRERERRSSSATEETQSTEATSLSERNGALSPDAGREPKEASSSRKDAGPARDAATTNVDELTTSMSSLKMVPRSITFGKRKGRSGFAKS